MKRLFESGQTPDRKNIGCGSDSCHVRPYNSLSNKLGIAIDPKERDRKVLVDGRLWHAVCWLSAIERGEVPPLRREYPDGGNRD